MPPFGENFKKNISLLAFSMGCIPSHLSSQIHLLQTPQLRRWSGKFIRTNFGQLGAGSLRKGLQCLSTELNFIIGRTKNSTIVIELEN